MEQFIQKKSNGQFLIGLIRRIFCHNLYKTQFISAALLTPDNNYRQNTIDINNIYRLLFFLEWHWIPRIVDNSFTIRMKTRTPESLMKMFTVCTCLCKCWGTRKCSRHFKLYDATTSWRKRVLRAKKRVSLFTSTERTCDIIG